MKNFPRFILFCGFCLSLTASPIHAEPLLQSKKNLVTVKPVIEKGQVTDFIAFTFEDFPKNEWVTISNKRPLLNFLTFKEMYKIKITDQGVHFKAIDGEELGISQICYCSIGDSLPGEEVEYQFKNEMGEVLSYASSINRPIEKKSTNKSFTLHATLKGIDPTIYQFTFNGLNEGELIKMRSESAGEVLEHAFRFFSENGPIGYLPEVIGVNGGQSRIRFARGDEDSVTVELDWGKKIIETAMRFK